MPATISVIIPTLAESRRASAIWEAVDSILSQPRVTVAPIIVINGARYDPALRLQLERSKSLSTHYQALGSLPRAMSTGRRLVDTEFFAFLDDDDRLIPDTLAERVSLMSSDPALDALVSNGLRCVADDIGMLFPTSEYVRQISDDPLRALFTQNWLASCGGTYRTATISKDFFDDGIDFLEWTYVAFRLALRKHIRFESGIRYFISDLPESQSKLDASARSGPVLWDRVRPLVAQRRDLIRLLDIQLSHSHHVASDYHRRSGENGRAWRHHVQSLTSCPTYGWRFLPYTRRLLTTV